MTAPPLVGCVVWSPELLFTQSLMHSFIPASCKRAAITPVFKSGIKMSPCNDRPISLTSTIIKVFERIVRKQVVAFLTRRGHLNNTQHGFRSGRTCWQIGDTCLYLEYTKYIALVAEWLRVRLRVRMVKGSTLTVGNFLSLENLNVIIRAIN